MKTFITGVNSDIGRYLAAHLIGHGNEVVGFDVTAPDDTRSGVEFVKGDVRDFSAVADAAKGCDTGIHLAVRTGASTAEEIFAVNVLGAYGFMAAACRNRFRNSVVVSSAPVHLLQNEADNDILLPTSDGDDHVYDLSKVLQEVVARDFHAHGVPTLCLRLGHVVWGERGVNLGEPIPLADFNYCRSGWVALEDVVTACARALETLPNDDRFEVLNIVGARDARARFEVAAVEKRLGVTFVYDFAEFN